MPNETLIETLPTSILPAPSQLKPVLTDGRGAVIEFPYTVKSGSVLVKIYQISNKGRVSYSISYFADGKRKLKMLVDFEEALKEAKAVGKTISKGELDVLELRSRDRLAYVHAVEALRPTGVALELAAREYAEAWKLLEGCGSLVEAAREYTTRHLHKMPPILVPDAVRELLQSKEKEKSGQEYRKVLGVYLNQFAKVFNCQVRSLSTAQVGDYLRNLEVSARSKNNARQVLGAFFKFCKERGWLPKDHDGVALVPKFREVPKGIAIFTPWELSKLLTYARPELVPFLVVGGFAGLRSAEIGRLDWREVRLDDRLIEVKAENAKTASRRLVPISDNLAGWLAPYVKPAGRVVPFDNLSKQIGWLVEDVQAGLKREAEDAGKEPEEAPKFDWKKNALRHSFISYRVAQTQNVAQVALEAGNSPQIIFKNYRELVTAKEAGKWFSIKPGEDGKIIFLEAAKAVANEALEKAEGVEGGQEMHANGEALPGKRGSKR